jgi:putative copper resistance protein D
MQAWSAVLLGARFLQFAAAVVLMGWPCWCLYGLKWDGDERGVAGARSAATGAAVMLISATLVWAMAETAEVLDDPAAGLNYAAVANILTGTAFGRVALLRVCLSLVSLALLRLPARPACAIVTGLGALALGSFAWSGHGGLGDGAAAAVHRCADVLHLLAAGLWLGALPPLALRVRWALRSGAVADRRAVHAALSRFSGIGRIAVSVVAVSGMVNSWFLVGNLRQAMYSQYAIILSVKILLFAAMLALAANHGLRLTPELRPADEPVVGVDRAQVALRSLRSGLAWEGALGILVLAVVALLGSLDPPGSVL